MRRTSGALLTLLALLGVLTGCGADTPDGTLTKDQVSDDAKVEKSETLGNQVTCPDINDAEDEIMFDRASDPDAEPVAATFNLSKGKAYEWVDSSVWEVGDPRKRLAELTAGIDACAKEHPDNYAPIESVKGFPDAVGYTAEENGFMRRIFVPIEGHVVVVSSLREGKDAFTVEPDDLLKDAVAEAKKLDA